MTDKFKEVDKNMKYMGWFSTVKMIVALLMMICVIINAAEGDYVKATYFLVCYAIIIFSPNPWELKVESLLRQIREELRRKEHKLLVELIQEQNESRTMPNPNSRRSSN